MGKMNVVNEDLDAEHRPEGEDMNNYGPLHDRVLLGFEINWQNGAVVVRLSHGELIEFKRVISINISRKFPWGPSNYILETRSFVVGNELKRFVIVMQSGDEISIIADEVVVPDGVHQCFPCAISTEAP
ncbi:hypothetical protein IC232_14370 [Microvirga sp. BT688]|uniref:hypothetical protein n=1 Tax=Microvirga sp. TaxID=1873136 RepID=UPI001688CDBD|nr:hypothetical protein [Microvirga sp.]MBD2747882.1 hypothetical protein [Microvirga sp.]